MKNRIINVILYSIFITMWIFLFFYMSLAFKAGLFSCFNDLYGNKWIFVGLLLTLIALLSPLYVRIVVKKERYIALLSIIICVMYALSVVCCYNFSSNQFKDFTVEKWREYPNQRFLMLDDLKERHMIIGMSNSQVILLLGQPNKIIDNTYIYEYDYGYIEVVFRDCLVNSISATNYF